MLNQSENKLISHREIYPHRNGELIRINNQVLLKNKKSYLINSNILRVWELCDGSNSITDIFSKINLNIPKKIKHDRILKIIDNLKKANLLYYLSKSSETSDTSI